VVANNMLISAQDFKNARKNQQLLTMSVEDFLADNNSVEYLLLRRNEKIFQQSPEAVLKEKNRGLRYELLFEHKQSKHLKLLYELRDNDLTIPIIARIYKVKKEKILK